MKLEWDVTGDDGASNSEPVEELDDQPSLRLLPRWLRRVPRAAWAGLLVTALLATVVTAVVTAGRHSARLPVSAASSATKPPPPPLSAGEAALAVVRQLALQPGPLPVYIRTSTLADGCALVPRGISPRRQVAAALHRALPGFRVADVGFTIDPFGAMCVLQVRARYGAASVAVVQIIAPGGTPQAAEDIGYGVVSDNIITTEYAYGVTAAGWQVTVGGTGDPVALPTLPALRDLALNPSLHW